VTGAIDDAMPRLVPPMLPSAGAGEPPTGADWRVEVAWTGHRCIAYVAPGRVRLLSGAGNSMTHAYPELTAPLLARCPPGGMVLDGTIVARGEEHARRPRLLKRRHSRYKPSESDIAAVPVDLQVADLLFFDGHPCVDLAYRDRRGLLEGLGLNGAPVWTTALFPATELDAIMRIAASEGVEAFHARHLGARYRPGGRSKFWVRVPVQRTRLVVVGGWTPTDPHRPDTIATLLLGVPDPDGLRYVGRVGIGVEQRRLLDGDLRGGAVEASPFTTELPAEAAKHAVWVTPDLVGRVEFAGWVGGTRLRLPRWCGLADFSEIDDTQYAEPPVPRPAPPVATPAGAAPHDPGPHDPGPHDAGPHDAGPNDAGPSGAGPSASGPSAARPSAPGTAAAGPAAPEAGSSAPGTLAPGTSVAEPVEARRLEQHFVYNSLNTIAALIRTDPARARDLVYGFADLSRVADGPAESTLGRELAAVRAYLQLEQARFGPRLQVAVDVDAGVDAVPVGAMRVLEIVREAVQRGIEPLREGGLVAVTARPVGDGCEVTVTAAAGETVRLLLPVDARAQP
jgi:bifunctional non-homologous end joining protein LigD